MLARLCKLIPSESCHLGKDKHGPPGRQKIAKEGVGQLGNVLRDDIIALTVAKSKKQYPARLRSVEVVATVDGRKVWLGFIITNNDRFGFQQGSWSKYSGQLAARVAFLPAARLAPALVRSMAVLLADSG